MRGNLLSSSLYKNVSPVLSFTYTANERPVVRMVVEFAKINPTKNKSLVKALHQRLRQYWNPRQTLTGVYSVWKFRHRRHKLFVNFRQELSRPLHTPSQSNPCDFCAQSSMSPQTQAVLRKSNFILHIR